jgi:altronate hydrolase
MQNEVLKLDSRDNVVIALADLRQGQDVRVENTVYTLRSNVPAKQKFATDDLPVGADVIMYGVLVGKAVKPVGQGELLSTSNVQHQATGFHEKSAEYSWNPPAVSHSKQRTFWDTNGRMAGRHAELLVGGSLGVLRNKNINILKQAFEEELASRNADLSAAGRRISFAVPEGQIDQIRPTVFRRQPSFPQGPILSEC